MQQAWRCSWLVLVATVLSQTASAQSGLWPEPVLPGLKRVDEGVGDLGPLSKSQRLVPLDLRIPTGFDGVYQFDRALPYGKSETMYMRSSGGLSAVFPRSVYVPAQAGLVPAIPAGTVFVIGVPRSTGSSVRWPSQSPLAVDMSVRGQPPAPPVARESAETTTIWNSERLRRQRVGRLLESLIAPK